MATKEMASEGGIEQKVGRFVTYLFLVVITALWNGYVLSVIWQWFIVDTFKLPAISIPQALGLFLVGRWIASGFPMPNEQNVTFTDPVNKRSVVGQIKSMPKSKWESFAYALLMGAIILGLGWIYHAFM